MILGCTGHRPSRLGGYSREAFSLLTGIAVQYLKENRPNEVLTGLALGWDQAVAVAAWNLSIPFTAIVPFPGQDSNWPEESQEFYQELLRMAADVRMVSLLFEKDHFQFQFELRNQVVVDSCDKLVAMWDGTYKTGTGRCLRYARENHKPYDNLYSLWKNHRDRVKGRS